MSGLLSIVEHRRRTVRAPENPMDKATVFSIFNKEIKEAKPTIQPGYFYIKPGSPEKPSLLVVGSSSWWREIDEEQPLLEIPHYSTQVAESIVRDYCSGYLGSNMTDCMPGLFWLPGEWTVKKLIAEKPEVLAEAVKKQENWYKALVRMADSFWSRTNGNPLTISEDMRHAAKALNLNGKEWMSDFTMMEMIKCVACGMPRNPAYPICHNCRNIVDMPLAIKLGIAPAPTGQAGQNLTPPTTAAPQVNFGKS